MKSSECSQQLQVAGEVMRGVGLRKVVPKEPRSPELLGGCGFSLNLGKGAGQPISPRNNLPTPHSTAGGMVCFHPALSLEPGSSTELPPPP